MFIKAVQHSKCWQHWPTSEFSSGVHRHFDELTNKLAGLLLKSPKSHVSALLK